MVDSQLNADQRWAVAVEKSRAPGVESRDSMESAWFREWAGGGQTTAGVSVNSITGMASATVFACVRTVAETMGMLPFHILRRLRPRGKERVIDHPIDRLINNPNQSMSAMVYWETTIGHAASWGNGRSLIIRDGGNAAIELLPIPPGRIRIRQDPNTRELFYTVADWPGQAFDPADVLDIAAFGFDGIQGYSPIELHRQMIGLGLAATEQQAAFYGNGARPMGILETDESFKKVDTGKKIREQWVEAYGGTKRAYDTAVLEGGMKYHTISIPARDMETVNILKLTDKQIAKLWRMPPHKVGIMDDATFSNIEQQAIEFVQDVVMPWDVRVSSEVNRKLLGGDPDLFAEHNVDGLLRGDAKTRSEVHSTYVNNGIKSRNEVRALEDLPPSDEEGADKLTIQTALTTLDQIGKEPEPAVVPVVPVAEPEPEDDDERMRCVADGYRGLFADGFERIIRVEADKVRRAIRHAGKRGEDAGGWVDKFYDDHAAYVRGALWPIMDACVAGLVGAADETISSECISGLVSRYVKLSRTAVTQALGNGGVDALFDRWTGRAASLAEQEVQELLAVVRASNGN